MKKLLLIALSLFVFSTPSFSAVTTSDRIISIDLYEGTIWGDEAKFIFIDGQLVGIEEERIDVWILDLSINDIDGHGGLEAIGLDLTVFSPALNFFFNEYNSSTDYYRLRVGIPGTSLEGSFFIITSPITNLLTPVGTNFLFYALPNEDYVPLNTDFIPILGDIDIDVNGESLQLTGPIGFAPVPEPMSGFLFAFGAFLLKWRKRQHRE